MAKVIFTISYEIKPNKREDYFSVVRELKNLVDSDGLESYAVYEVKGKPNNFEEIYTFNSQEAFDQFDDNQNERINILLDKLAEITADNSTKYSTLYEVLEN